MWRRTWNEEENDCYKMWILQQWFEMNQLRFQSIVELLIMMEECMKSDGDNEINNFDNNNNNNEQKSIRIENWLNRKRIRHWKIFTSSKCSDGEFWIHFLISSIFIGLHIFLMNITIFQIWNEIKKIEKSHR